MQVVNKKTLFILHLPPPIHGSSLVGKFINKSKRINTKFNCRYINLGTSKSIDEIGKSGFKKMILYISIILRTINQLIAFKPDIVYLAMTAKGIAFYKDMVMVFLVKLFGIQLVIHFHNKGVSINQNKILDNFLYKCVFKNTKIILLSKYLYSDIKKYVKEENVFYCPNGVPELSLDPVYKSKDNVQLLFLSNLIESKGVYVLLEALKILKNKKNKFSCNFVGDVGDISKNSFNNKVSNLQLEDHVHYLGKKYDQEKIAIFRDTDIFVLPTFYHNECFPLVLLEASQFALPMVSTFEGAIPEIINDGINGFLVEKNDITALADKLELLIKDETLRTKLGNAAFKKFKKEYTLTKFESNMCTILKSIN